MVFPVSRVARRAREKYRVRDRMFRGLDLTRDLESKESIA